ncbi:MAG: hypothetical protein ACQRW7_10145 [Caulobacterales bacterium]|uniref:hypothetical protein n=1 Tax=Glycocaulis sp. TaxID=1969725 RepID=UPI003FA0B29F
MPTLRLLPLLLVPVLWLSACGNGDETREPPPTRVTADDAAEAAAILGLEEQGRASWTAREFSGGVFRFEGFALALSDDAERPARLEAAIMEIASPRLEDSIVRFDRLTLENTVLSDGEGGETRVERLLVDRPGPELSRSIAAAFSGETPDLPALADNLGGYGFRELVIGGLSATLPEGEGVLQAAELTLTGLDETGLDGLLAESISFEAPQTRFGIESVVMEEVGARFLQSVFTGTSATALPFIMSGTPSDYYRRLDVTGLSGLTNGLTFDMESLSVTVTEEQGGLRTLAALPALRLGAEARSPAGANVERMLDYLDYEAIVLRFESDTLYDPVTDTLRTINDNLFVWEDGLTLSAHQEVSGVQAYADAIAAARSAGVTDPQTFAGYESLLRLEALEVRLEDQSLLDRSFSAYADMNGVTPDQMRVQASALIALGLSALPAEIPRPFLNAIAQPLSDFVRDGGTLVIRLDPPEPVALPDLTSPSGEFDIDRLGLGVRVERTDTEVTTD